MIFIQTCYNLIKKNIFKLKGFETCIKIKNQFVCSYYHFFLEKRIFSKKMFCQMWLELYNLCGRLSKTFKHLKH